MTYLDSIEVETGDIDNNVQCRFFFFVTSMTRLNFSVKIHFYKRSRFPKRFVLHPLLEYVLYIREREFPIPVDLQIYCHHFV